MRRASDLERVFNDFFNNPEFDFWRKIECKLDFSDLTKIRIVCTPIIGVPLKVNALEPYPCTQRPEDIIGYQSCLSAYLLVEVPVVFDPIRVPCEHHGISRPRLQCVRYKAYFSPYRWDELASLVEEDWRTVYLHDAIILNPPNAKLQTFRYGPDGVFEFSYKEGWVTGARLSIEPDTRTREEKLHKARLFEECQIRLETIHERCGYECDQKCDRCYSPRDFNPHPLPKFSDLLLALTDGERIQVNKIMQFVKDDLEALDKRINAARGRSVPYDDEYYASPEELGQQFPNEGY